MSNLYFRENLLNHMKNPSNYGVMSNPDIQVDVVNTSCGDEITLFVKIDNKIIKDVKFTGESCGVAKASASMLSEQLIGMDLETLSKVSKEDVLSNFKEPLTSSRVKCALLIYEGVQKLKNEI